MDSNHAEPATENGKDDVVDITDDSIPTDNPTSLSLNAEVCLIIYHLFLLFINLAKYKS
jgi:hypothetical protein